MIDQQKFGRRLAYLRHAAKLKQHDVAVRCSVSIQAVSKWETGKNFPDILILDDLAEVLGVELKDLFLIDEIKQS